MSEPRQKMVRFGQSLVASRHGLNGVGVHVAAVLKERRAALGVIDSFKVPRDLAGSESGFRQGQLARIRRG